MKKSSQLQEPAGPGFPLVFALTSASARKNGGQVLVFWEDRMELLQDGKVSRQFSWQAVQKLQFVQGRKSGGMATFLLGSMGRKVEDVWEMEGKQGKLRLVLELDSKFRKEELLWLFRHLYRKLSHFEERNGAGERLFLLQGCSSEEISQRKQALIAGEQE
jgi:hypothetical protein